jgi:hypothetical protein
MPVVLVHKGPTLTQERYEQVVDRFTGGRKMESPSDWPVEGLLTHIAGQGESGFRGVDVWESEDACRRFGEMPMPLLHEMGVEEQPEIYSAAHVRLRLDSACAPTGFVP